MPKYLTKLICGFYYQILNIDEQTLYKEIGIAISKGISCLTVRYANKNMFRKVCIALRYDNPEFYYWDMKRSTIDDCHIVLRYRLNDWKIILDIKRKLRDKRAYIGQLCYDSGKRSRQEMLAYMYIYFLEEVKYIDEKISGQECKKWIHDIEGCLLKKSAGCLGIAQSVNYICHELDIFSILIAGKVELGESKVNHVWNLVEVNGEIRHLDITKDIIEKDTNTSRHFLLKDVDMSEYLWRTDIYPLAE